MTLSFPAGSDRGRRHDLSGMNPAPVVAIAVIAAVLVAVGYGMNHSSYIIWGGFWVAPLLLLLSLPVAKRAARLDGDAIGRIVLLAAALKVLVAPPLRYWMAFSLYDGASDAARYHSAAVNLAPLLRQGIYRDLGEVSGTRFLEILTGQVYAFTGPTRFGGFMVFSWFSFLGLYLFYRAFRTAYPDGDGRRYALLVFFFPTLQFWPSSIGKEAFMMLVLGAAALGAAELLTGRLRGLAWAGFGLWGAAVVRPHMALIVAAGLVVAAPIAMWRGGAHRAVRRRGRLGSAVLLVGLLLASSTLIGVTESFFGLESLNAETAHDQLDETTKRSGVGGSAFSAASPTDPVEFVSSAVTVLFRPFPFEVPSGQALLTSLEGIGLLVLGGFSLGRLARAPLELLRKPYLALALVYTFAFVYAFSSIVNFGILARQRSQLLPMLFVVLCLPRGRPVTAGPKASRPLGRTRSTAREPVESRSP